MADTGIVGIALIIVNLLVSYRGFNNRSFFDGYKFEVDKVLVKKDYIRLLSSGFLHVSWFHLVFNMVSLYAFAGDLEFITGPLGVLAIYFAGLLGGNLFALLVHRNHADYSAVGASGAVGGIIFASIALFPYIKIGFLGIEPFIPGWLFGVLYVVISIYGIKSGSDNIGHEAHLGGAMVGMLTALLLQPYAFTANYLAILIIFVPAAVFIYLIITKPYLLMIDKPLLKKKDEIHHSYTIDHRYNAEQAAKQKEVDRILDKINRHGINSLSEKEKKTLKENT